LGKGRKFGREILPFSTQEANKFSFNERELDSFENPLPYREINTLSSKGPANLLFKGQWRLSIRG